MTSLSQKSVNNSLTRSNKLEIMSWSIPDYSSGLSINTPYTTPSDGLVVLSRNNSATQDGIKINGVDPQSEWKLYSDCQYIVPKGSVITEVRNANGVVPIHFFPLKGV